MNRLLIGFLCVCLVGCGECVDEKGCVETYCTLHTLIPSGKTYAWICVTWEERVIYPKK